jgi:hypothetical protein
VATAPLKSLSNNCNSIINLLGLNFMTTFLWWIGKVRGQPNCFSFGVHQAKLFVGMLLFSLNLE